MPATVTGASPAVSSSFGTCPYRQIPTLASGLGASSHAATRLTARPPGAPGSPDTPAAPGTPCASGVPGGFGGADGGGGTCGAAAGRGGTSGRAAGRASGGAAGRGSSAPRVSLGSYVPSVSMNPCPLTSQVAATVPPPI
ncbi:hypothetical protein AB0A60_24685 [Streptomyces sp. NPDC046275]|uniref:hypothetical protein n=1 Tax=Streptomyces sp. NPDC046275 TaxID=3157201 RepID=UPI0033E4E95B